MHLRVHLIFLLEEAPSRVRDRLVIIGDLVDDDGLDADRNSLRRHALEIELRLVDVEREPANFLHARDDEHSLADDDLEPESGGVALRAVMSAPARDDQGLAWLCNAVHQHHPLLWLEPTTTSRTS